METIGENVEKMKLVPFMVIQKAVEGDVISINKVLRHCEGYISCLAVRKMYDEYGNEYYCIDETLRSRLEAKLIKTILGFKLVR